MSDDNNKPPDKPNNVITLVPPPRPTPTEEEEDLALLADEEFLKLDPESVKNLDVRVLRDMMLKGVYVTEAVLFSQANFEVKRIMKGRRLLNKLEAQIFSEEEMKKLNPEQKLRLYYSQLQNMQGSLGFLSNLHANINSGLESVAKIEKLKEDNKTFTPEQESSANVDVVRKKIMAQISKKSKAKAKEDK
jgi:hypothetical protein